MTVKLLLLKSNEDVIADVKELTIEERVIGYQLKNPYRVTYEEKMNGQNANNSLGGQDDSVE